MNRKLLFRVFIFMVWSSFFILPLLYADSPVLLVGQFSQSNLDNWESKKFEGETQYSLSVAEGKKALKAVSINSASGLIRKIRVDIEKYPYLNWSWRIENRIDGTFDETLKSGDDYAARIYVVVSGGLAFWNTRAVNYVWARHARKGDIWPNAFAGKNAMIIALRSWETPISTWMTEKRNIKKDMKNLFGRDIQYIDAVVLMSDTDNTKKNVTAFYGDIYFSSE
ncbi:MAG: DUF3047 domain-containing protein [Pseudomonadota bacterium]